MSALKLRLCLVFILAPFRGRDFTPYSLVRILGSRSRHEFLDTVHFVSYVVNDIGHAVKLFVQDGH
jgi:hypothetical protein